MKKGCFNRAKKRKKGNTSRLSSVNAYCLLQILLNFFLRLAVETAADAFFFIGQLEDLLKLLLHRADASGITALDLIEQKQILLLLLDQ